MHTPFPIRVALWCAENERAIVAALTLTAYTAGALSCWLWIHRPRKACE